MGTLAQRAFDEDALDEEALDAAGLDARAFVGRSTSRSSDLALRLPLSLGGAGAGEAGASAARAPSGESRWAGGAEGAAGAGAGRDSRGTAKSRKVEMKLETHDEDSRFVSHHFDAFSPKSRPDGTGTNGREAYSDPANHSPPS